MCRGTFSVIFYNLVFCCCIPKQRQMGEMAWYHIFSCIMEAECHIFGSKKPSDFPAIKVKVTPSMFFYKYNLLTVSQLLYLKHAMNIRKEGLLCQTTNFGSVITANTQCDLRRSRFRTPDIRRNIGTQAQSYLLPDFLSTNPVYV